MEFVGRTVTKGLKGFGALAGTVRSYDPASGLFKIAYDDGDSEELESREMAALFGVGSGAEAASGAMRPGRRSKRRRHAGVEGAGNACNDKVVVVGLEAVGNEGLRGGEGFCGDLQRNGWVSEDLRGKINLNDPVEESMEDNLAGAEVCNGYSSRHVDGKGGFDLNSGFDLNQGLNLNDGCDSNVSSEEKAVKRSRIDLNLEATSDLDENLEEDLLSERKKCLIDLNLGVDTEVKDVECNANGQLCERVSCQLVEDINVDIARNGEERFIESNIANGPSQLSQDVPVEIDARSGLRPMSGSTDTACEEGRSGLVDVSVSHVFGNGSFGDVACDSVEDAQVSLPQKDGAFKTCDAMHTGNQGNFASPHEHGSRRGRKRKYLNNLNSAGTVLRRSARKGSTKSRDTGVAPLDAVNDLASSPAVSAITEDKPDDSIPSPKLQLPSSSQDVKLDGTLVLDGFCVYAFLRSFGSLLFLSPFELEDFVVALKSDSANSLVDSIHVSLLITLRKHLEHLSCEGSTSALNCLRSLNWDLLDLVTWPIFLVEYLLLHGSKLQGGLELCHLNLLKDDYYKQPMPVKVEVLRCLCDEVMEAEVIRSELSRRSSVTDPDVDIDRSMKRTGAMDASGRAQLTEGTTDDTDWNSDECCLCKMDGNLICCDGCPAAYHSRCVGVVNDLLPEGDWYCPDCTLERNKSGIRSRRSFRGAERLGIDPHGRLYYSCCDYLLVLDSSETDVSFYYYHKDDLHLVTEVLQCSAKSYSGILKAINRQWGIHFSSRKAKAILDSSNSISPSEVPVKGQFVAASMTVASLPPCTAYEGIGKADDDKHLDKESLLQASDLTGFETSKSGKEVATVVETPHMSSEGSFETTLTSSDPAKQWQSCSNGYVQLLEKSDMPGRFPNQGDFCMTSAISDCKADKTESAAATVASLTFISAKNDAPVEQGRTTYVNLYRFGQIAASVAEELAEKSSDKVKEDHVRSDEETILIQLKAISQKIAKFSWPDEISIAAQKEKCGWCFFCRFPSDEFDCLFKLYAQPAQESFESEMDILQSLPSKKGHLVEVIGRIISMEHRLRGLLLGPWLSPHYTKIWHRSVTKALDLASLKSLLLKLESNLRHLAISEEWFKYEDSSVMLGSASHVVTSSSCTSSKPSSSRKRGRRSDLELNKPSHNSSSAPSTFWWRGGRLSRRVFNWKVLPCSLIHKAARQAGCMKIPGILYPESSDFARRSKHVAWRAAVESSISTEQLALQVRELHSNIRWEDIENTNPLSKFDKELKKSARAFKKVIIRRKAVEGDAAKYLLDFGKRRVIPDVVMRHGSIVQEGSSERKKYWLNECFVPLHLLKSFEEKRIARNSNKMSTSGDSDSHGVKKFSARLCKGDLTLKKQLCKAKGLSYLFSRAERAEFYRCGHCKRDVLISEAVSCQYCKGIFHKRHVRKSAGAIADECTYTCHQCQTGKPQKAMERVGKTEKPRGNTKSRTGKGKIMGQSAKSLSKTSKKALAKRRLVKLRGVKRAATSEQSVQSSTCRRVPLRRSARQAIKSIALQNKSRGIKKGKRMKYKRRMPKKPEKDTSWKKKRTEVCYSRWVNGLLLSTRASEEQVMNFGKMRLVHPNGNVKVERTEVKCRLCGEVAHDSLSNYIACESCEVWYHGDAFGLDDEKMHKIMGFRCHECRKRAPPICPYGPTTKRSKSADVQNDAAFECSEEVLNVSPPSNEVNFRDDSNGKENSAASVPVDEAL